VTLGLGTLDVTAATSGRSFSANGEGNTLSLAGWKIQSGSLTNIVANLNGTANWTITGPIVNGNGFSNGVSINATGLTTFGGNNTYDGTTIVGTNATLRITSATGLGSTSTGTTVDTGGQLQLSGGITVSAGEALSLSGGAGSRATLRNISGANNYNGAITFNNGTNRIDSDAGTLTLSSFASTLASTRSLLVGGEGDTTFTGRFTGTGSGTLTKDGAGTLTLANTNFDIQGGVRVNSGKLALAANNALGTNNRAVGINGGALDITTFDNTVGAVSLTNGTIAGTTGVLTGTSYAVESGTISARLGGGGALTKSGSGSATLSGSNSYSGLTAVNGGTLTLSGNNSAASGGVQVEASTLNINNTNALGTGTLRILAANAILNNTSGGAITNAGNNAVIWQGTTFAFGTASNTANNNLNLGSGAVSVDSGRTLNLLGTGTTLTMGTITSSSAATTGNSYNINGSGNTLVLGGLNIRSAGTTNVIDNLDGTANITINGAITDGNAFANGLKIKSTGTTTFSGNNTYTGVTEIIAGATLKLDSSTALGSTDGATAVSSGGLLDLNGQTTAETLDYTGTGGLLNSAAGAATVSGAVDIGTGMTVNTTGDITLSGKLTGTVSKNLTKSGAGTLKYTAGNSDFAGTSTVSGGTLLVTANGNVSSSSTIVNNGGTLRVNGTAGGVTVNLGGSLEGIGTVGAVTLTTGSFLKPGNSPGTLTASSAIWEAGSYYNWEIDSNASSALEGTNWDLFSVTGSGVLDMSALSSGATMNLVLNSLSGFDLTSSTNRTWVIAQAGSLLGTGGTLLTAGANVSDYFNINATAFTSVTPSLVNEWRVEVGDTGKTLNLMAIPEPSTGSMLGLGFAGLVVTRILRRKSS
jgi:autotransporter-associated beta strand protein